MSHGSRKTRCPRPPFFFPPGEEGDHGCRSVLSSPWVLFPSVAAGPRPLKPMRRESFLTWRGCGRLSAERQLAAQNCTKLVPHPPVHYPAASSPGSAYTHTPSNINSDRNDSVMTHTGGPKWTALCSFIQWAIFSDALPTAVPWIRQDPWGLARRGLRGAAGLRWTHTGREVLGEVRRQRPCPQPRVQDPVHPRVSRTMGSEEGSRSFLFCLLKFF